MNIDEFLLGHSRREVEHIRGRAMNARPRANCTKNKREIETHLELNGVPSSASRRASLYTEIVPTKRPKWVRAMSGMSESAHLRCAARTKL